MQCRHLDQVRTDRPRGKGCEECLKMGDTWVHLRLCRTCGHVGCCDSSPGKHATKHFGSTRHPLIRSFQPGEGWTWCYLDQEMVG
jgi:uncharacterized UBP type Zn finger protein